MYKNKWCIATTQTNGSRASSSALSAPASWLVSQLATSQSCVSSCGASKAPPRFAASAPSTRRFRRGAINQVQLVA